MLPHPGEQIGRLHRNRRNGAKILRSPAAAVALSSKIGEKSIGIAVAIAHERERDRIFRHRKTREREILQRVIVDDDEAREMQRAEFAERHERVVRVRHARVGGPVHRREQLFEIVARVAA